ncbi:hypothetical protein VOLCADRAFT_88501 [Volvox carteri f. nagariensis]|uniref:Uncharacterized protein n=1 Tax=Volvox carteri f. nagariensis TaxID=3068 RepID=D8TP63_VOLCA|nr:uncharacterized protein VOLCADRAFT_88501 [Volvox carteri f. nagariensis]EFJ50706.1 hypothetical protein VOLCADRAFT_88501 [Volvox carteri f. nagariensis]|eukprot:XP_002948299.1 hypothetical protein VOLCADRAFT_88501 [Volvox carteri f. nagariensis]
MTGHDRAECLLGLLEAYCNATGMAANAAKCEVLIFGGATRERKRLVEAEYRLGFVTVERLKMSCMFSKNVPLTRAYGLSMMHDFGWGPSGRISALFQARMKLGGRGHNWPAGHGLILHTDCPDTYSPYCIGLSLHYGNLARRLRACISPGHPPPLLP